MPRRFTRKPKRNPKRYPKRNPKRAVRSKVRSAVRAMPMQAALIRPISMNTARVKPVYMSKTLTTTYSLVGGGQIDHTSIPLTTTYGVVPADFAWIRLDAVPAAELAAYKELYTHYKIRSVTYQWSLNTENFAGIVANATVIPRLFVRYQYDANGNLALTIPQYSQMSNYKIFSFTGEANTCRYTWYPRVFPTTYSNGLAGTSSNAVGRPPWYDVDFPVMSHVGCNWLMPFLPPNATLTLETTLRFALKTAR